MPHVTLAGDRAGEYLVAEERPDGCLLLRPDTSAAAILDRVGVRPATLEEFEAEHSSAAASRRRRLTATGNLSGAPARASSSTTGVEVGAREDRHRVEVVRSGDLAGASDSARKLAAQARARLKRDGQPIDELRPCRPEGRKAGACPAA